MTTLYVLPCRATFFYRCLVIQLPVKMRIDSIMQKMQGFTLLEVLISLFLLSLALIGINSVQLSAMHQARNAYNTQQALTFAQNMSTYLRSHHGQGGDYQIRWHAEVQSRLPQGRAFINGSYPHYRISVLWGERPPHVCEKSQSGKSGCMVVDLNL